MSIRSLPDTDTPGFYAVRLHLHGRGSIEFLSESGSSTLQMLRDCMSRAVDDPDEMVYLNLGETGTDGLYFMASSLTSLELSPVAD